MSPLANRAYHFSLDAVMSRGRFTRSARRKGQLRLRHMDWFGPYAFATWYRTPWKKAR